jgi:hypothetical protein
VRRLAPAIVLVGLSLGNASALAQNLDPPAGAEEGGRYSFHRTGDTFLRLDSKTGQASECSRSVTGWACNTVADERAALEKEIARLQSENGRLKKELLAKGEAPKEPETSPKLPTDAELDRAMAFMKNVWRRLIEMMADLQRDMRKT